MKKIDVSKIDAVATAQAHINRLMGGAEYAMTITAAEVYGSGYVAFDAAGSPLCNSGCCENFEARDVRLFDKKPKKGGDAIGYLEPSAEPVLIFEVTSFDAASGETAEDAISYAEIVALDEIVLKKI